MMNKLLPIVTAVLFSGAAVQAAQVTVNVSNIDEEKGEVRVVLYDAANYLTHHAPYTLADPATAGTMSFVFKDVPIGDWAVLAYHDVNSNHDLDRNFLGIPTEQFGFSNNPGYYHQPKFSETSFVIASEDTALDIKLSDK